MKKINGIEFTHKGMFLGVPVYLSNTYSESPVIQERSVLLIPVMIIMCFMFDVFTMISSYINPNFEPLFPIKITGKI